MRRLALVSMTLSVVVLAAATTSYADNWFGWGKSERGSGHMTTETRQVEPFDRIELNGGMDLFVTIGEPTKVSVSIDDNLQDNVIIERRGKRTLRIRTESMSNVHRHSRIDITVPSLVGVRVSGSGDIEVEGLKRGDFDVHIDGSSDVNVSGEIDHLGIDINGSGDVDTRNLKAQSADVSINGSGDVNVYASDEFYGSVFGSGDIVVYGNPQQYHKHVSGSGDITRH